MIIRIRIHITGRNIRENRTAIIQTIWLMEPLTLGVKKADVTMKSPVSAISCGPTKMLALRPIGNIREAVNFKLRITASKIKVDAAGL